MRTLYPLDTNTCSYHIAGNPPQVRARIRKIGIGATAISAVTEGELRFGVARRPEATRRRESVAAFLDEIEILSWDSASACAYGLLCAEQERRCRPLSSEDLMIAAHALAAGLTLVTRDQAFSFIDGLRTEDWTSPAS